MDDTMMTFEELFTDHHDVLVEQVCQRYNIDYDTAETAVVDALLEMHKVHEKDPEHVQYHPASHFLATLIRSRVADNVRHATCLKMAMDVVELGDTDVELEDPRQDPTRTIRETDFLRTATKGLNQQERLILIGKYYNSQTGTEIGAQLNLSESRVWQLHDDIVQRLQARKADFV